MDSKQIKATLKLLKTPSATKLVGDRATWSKRGGHAGRKTISKVREAALANGFQSTSSSVGNTPDGSRVGTGTVYRNEAGVEVELSSSYAATADGNDFRIEVRFPK